MDKLANVLKLRLMRRWGAWNADEYLATCWIKAIKLVNSGKFSRVCAIRKVIGQVKLIERRELIDEYRRRKILERDNPTVCIVNTDILSGLVARETLASLSTEDKGIVMDLASGDTLETIGARLGLHHTTIGRRIQKLTHKLAD